MIPSQFRTFNFLCYHSRKPKVTWTITHCLIKGPSSSQPASSSSLYTVQDVRPTSEPLHMLFLLARSVYFACVPACVCKCPRVCMVARRWHQRLPQSLSTFVFFFFFLNTNTHNKRERDRDRERQMNTCGNQWTTCRSPFSPSTVWILGIKLRFSGSKPLYPLNHLHR